MLSIYPLPPIVPVPVISSSARFAPLAALVLLRVDNDEPKEGVDEPRLPRCSHPGQKACTTLYRLLITFGHLSKESPYSPDDEWRGSGR